MCVYGFTIAQESSAGPPTAPSFCHFVIHGEDDKGAVRSPFIDVPCEEMNNYRCGASWSDNGYMVFTVDDTSNNRRGYFDIPDSELVDGSFSSTHRSPAYVVVPSAVSEAIILPQIHTRDEVPDIADLGNATTDSSGESANAEDSVSNAPEMYPLYENGASQVYAIEDAGVSPVDVQTTTAPTDINPSSDGADPGVPIDTTIQDAVLHDSGMTEVSNGNDFTSQDETNPEDISSAQETDAVDTRSGLPANVTVSASANATDSPLETVQDAIPEQLGSVQGSGDDDDSDDISAKPVTSSPIYSDGLPTVPEIPITWSLHNVTRAVSYGPNAVVIGFQIEVLPEYQEPIPCHIKVDLDEDVEPMFASWSTEQCQEGDWYFSWGYDEKTDSAVATLIR
ncbi:hypothetical protein SPBR_00695 [Sporothrix brasiliensis 5110]|uniref:Uncharacterized protein n=1 Tax=Sporothrix brasiliensis 5110 TaxID=1398154 RepID=A0A0C2FIF5_9PEZI|nr:uncharacterized protein SPBR_00695 [Sporothrix brasiliensis 5110]KIH90853.1 hypothetical protein SPBR_00695 [Sporothrix brasiliensis 5110]